MTTPDRTPSTPADPATTGQDQWCSVCEIKVPRGYRNCPKCQQRMPAARRRAWAAGGTSVSLAGARRPFWLLLLLGGAAAGAIYFHFLLGEESISRRHRLARAAASIETHDGGVGIDSGIAEDAAAAATETQRADAISQLQSDLDAAGVVARAELASDDPETVVLRSPTCDAQELASVVAQAAADLAEADFTGARCFAPSGVVLYKTTW